MKKTKLIQQLRSFSEKDLQQFSLFIKSPFHNSNKRVTDLFLLLKPYHQRNYDSNRLQKEILFYKIFPTDTNYHDSNMRALMSSLSQKIENFLIIRELKKDHFLSQQLLAKGYNENGLDNQFEKINRKKNGQLTKLEVQDMEVQLQQLQNNWVYYFKPNDIDQRTKRTILEDTMFHLDQFYLQAKLRLGLEMKNRAQMYQEEIDILFWDYLNREISQNKTLQTPVYQLHSIFELLRHKFDHQHFIKGIELYNRHFNQIGKWEQKAFLKLLLNHISKLTYNGHNQYWKHAHALHLIALEKQLIVNNGKIAFSNFFNLPGAAFILGKFEWAEDFINEYQKFLPDEFKLDIIALVSAYLNYYKGVSNNKTSYFDIALDYLLKIKLNNTRFSLHSRNLRLRIYFDFFVRDNHKYDFLMDYIAAYQKFIERTVQISVQKKIPYKNFIVFTKKLVRLYLNPTRSTNEIQELKNAINKESNLYSKSWLIEKVETI